MGKECARVGWAWMLIFVLLAGCGSMPEALPTGTSTAAPTPRLIQPTPYLTVTPSPLPATFLPPTPPVFTSEQQVFKRIIGFYFDRRYLAMNTLQVPDFSGLVSEQPDAQEFERMELLKLAYELEYLRLNHLRYAEYSYSLDYRDLTVNANSGTAIITLLEGYKVADEISPALLGQGDGIKHTLTLRQEGRQWKIVSDSYNDLWWGDLRRQGDTNAQIIRREEEFLRSRSYRTINDVHQPWAGIAAEPQEVERWQEYEIALAKKLLPASNSTRVLCEWEILGRSLGEVYVWAVCMDTQPMTEISKYLYPVASLPAAVHIASDGAVEGADIPTYGPHYLESMRRLIPYGARNEENRSIVNIGKLEQHLDFRREHPQEPPLIVSDESEKPEATPIPILTGF